MKDLADSLTPKLTGGNEAQRNCRPVKRLVRRFVFIDQRHGLKKKAVSDTPELVQIRLQ